MTYFVRGVTHSEDLRVELNRILPKPSPGVVKWNYAFDDDWSGDPAIFFWVTLTDEASKKANLSKATAAFQKAITDRIDFRNDWGLFPYFYFRSESEQAKLKDKAYA